MRAVIAESFERIHRSNLVGMGVLPLQFEDGESAASLGLDGSETFTIDGVAESEAARRTSRSRSSDADGTIASFTARCRIDTYNELEYFKSGGILHYVLRKLAAQ